MENKIRKNIDGSWDLSEINTLSDLNDEINYLKNKLDQDFTRLKSETSQIPKQAVKATVGRAFPFIAQNDIAAKNTAGIATTLIGGLAGTLMNKSKGATPKSRIINTIKGMGVTAAMQGAMVLVNVINKWNKKRQARKELKELRVKTEVLQLLKADMEQKKV